MDTLSDTVPTAFRLARDYDRLRLSTYKQRGRRGDAMAIGTAGESVLLRFDDVGYFNLIYAGCDIDSRIEMVEQFFDGSPHECRLLWPSLRDEGALADLCRSRGWQGGEALVWVSGPCVAPTRTRDEVSVRRARSDEAEVFFQTYLRAFEAAAERIPAAVDNMRHLFDLPDLHCLLAVDNREPVGVGMVWQCGSDALLCAGAMVPSHRGVGGHEALLAARLALARDLGCERVHSWAAGNGRSAANMARSGLRAVATSRTWRFRRKRGA